MKHFLKQPDERRPQVLMSRIPRRPLDRPCNIADLAHAVKEMPEELLAPSRQVAAQWVANRRKKPARREKS